MSTAEQSKRLAGRRACEQIRDGQIIGLGTGSTVYYAIQRLAEMIAEGLKVTAVCTSLQTERLARAGNIPLVDFFSVEAVDLTIDGVDEVCPEFHGIKGGGGALFREKQVANISRQVTWVMDDRKLVNQLGAFPLPIEVAPFAAASLLRRLTADGFTPRLRLKKGGQLSYAANPPSLDEQISFLIAAGADPFLRPVNTCASAVETNEAAGSVSGAETTSVTDCKPVDLIELIRARSILELTDNGNYIFDLLSPEPGADLIADPVALERRLKHYPGVLETGIFLNGSSRVIVGHADGQISERSNPNF
ncbi:MAG: ribose 5-phosphate isomerase A [Clostridiaceae bacterium]|nr:ribose 5-phosphate isomerase A [Clostridiaceae bacterium]